MSRFTSPSFELALQPRRSFPISNYVAALYPHPLVWGVGVLALTVNSLWLLFSERLSLDLMSYATFPLNFVLVVFLVAVIHFPQIIKHPGSRFFSGVMGMFFAYSNLRLFNHLCFSFNIPWSDDILIRWSDFFLPFWSDYAAWVVGKPFVLSIFEIAYRRVEVPMGLLFAVLCFTNKHKDVSGFVFSTMLTAVVCSVISAFFPAKGAIDMLAGSDLRSILPADAGTYHIKIVGALQNARHVKLNFWALDGLSTFPSFHTALGVLLIIWSRRAHWSVWFLATAYSVTMIASTPILGGHYFIDLVAGAAVAIACAKLSPPILEWWPAKLAAQRPEQGPGNDVALNF